MTGRRPAPAPVERAGLVGRSPAFHRLLEQVALVAPLDVPVCLGGEAGVGKRRVARAIHEASPRAGGPFHAVACAAVPSGGLGLFAPGGPAETAAGGTLLLEDVDALGQVDQAQLVRFLAAVRRRMSGVHRKGDPDVRVLVSTTTDLKTAVATGRFREDLYLGLAVLPLRVPPLGERRDDVRPLAARFLQQAAADHRGAPLTLSPRAMAALEAADWPGNLGQLAAVIAAGVHRAVADGVRQVEEAHLLPPAVDPPSAMRTLQDATRRFQARLVARALDWTRWDVAAAAELLDLGRSHLDSLIRTYQLEPSA
jgi:DNA-binding NtrC family response regulator